MEDHCDIIESPTDNDHSPVHVYQACDIIESPSDNDHSPVHVYQAFNRYHSQVKASFSFLRFN